MKMKKTMSLKHVGVAFLCGSLFFSGVAMAKSSSISVSFEKLRFLVQGEDRSTASGTFDNGGKQVPSSILYEGTTYVPVRMVSDLLDQPVYWDGQTKSVYLGETEVSIVKADGTVIGHAALSQGDQGVRVHLEVSGLAPGKHGLHLHEKNFEGSDFKTAGGHFNPTAKKHGHNNPEGHHMGDFHNLNVNADGKGMAEFVAEGMTLEKGKDLSVWGKSIVIHAAEDDGTTDPSGNSGDRIAGANVK